MTTLLIQHFATVEAAPDGIYIIRTSVAPARMNAADCVRNHKALANVERAFRSLKTATPISRHVAEIHSQTRSTSTRTSD